MEGHRATRTHHPAGSADAAMYKGGSPVGPVPAPPAERSTRKGETWRAAATVCNQDCYTLCTVDPDFCCN